MRKGAGRSHFTVTLCPPCYMPGGGQGEELVLCSTQTEQLLQPRLASATAQRVYARGHSRCSPSTHRPVTEQASSPTHFWLARNKSVCISTDSSSPRPSSSLQQGGTKKTSLHPGGRTLCPALGGGAGNQEHHDLWLHQSWAGGRGNMNQKKSRDSFKE